MQAAEVFSQKHFPEVVQHEEFILLSQGEVEKLIKCDEIQVQICLDVMVSSRLGNYKTCKVGCSYLPLGLHNQVCILAQRFH